jgi:hypothetical protein
VRIAQREETLLSRDRKHALGGKCLFARNMDFVYIVHGCDRLVKSCPCSLFDEIDERFWRGDFPPTDALGPLGEIIFKCWHDEYPDAKRVSSKKLKVCMDFSSSRSGGRAKSYDCPAFILRSNSLVITFQPSLLELFAS